MKRIALKKCLKEQGISYQEGADRIGTSYKWFANFVAGHKNASLKRYREIIDLCDGKITLEDLAPEFRIESHG